MHNEEKHDDRVTRWLPYLFGPLPPLAASSRIEHSYHGTCRYANGKHSRIRAYVHFFQWRIVFSIPCFGSCPERSDELGRNFDTFNRLSLYRLRTPSSTRLEQYFVYILGSSA